MPRAKPNARAQAPASKPAANPSGQGASASVSSTSQNTAQNAMPKLRGWSLLGFDAGQLRMRLAGRNAKSPMCYIYVHMQPVDGAMVPVLRIITVRALSRSPMHVVELAAWTSSDPSHEVPRIHHLADNGFVWRELRLKINAPINVFTLGLSGVDGGIVNLGHADVALWTKERLEAMKAAIAKGAPIVIKDFPAAVGRTGSTMRMDDDVTGSVKDAVTAAISAVWCRKVVAALPSGTDDGAAAADDADNDDDVHPTRPMPDILTARKQSRDEYAAMDEELRPALTKQLEQCVEERNKTRAAEIKVIEDAIGMLQRRVLAPEDKFTVTTVPFKLSTGLAAAAVTTRAAAPGAS